MRVEELNTWEWLQKQMTWVQLGDVKGKTILEFGCGNGVMGAHYANQNHVVAIDPNQEILLANPYDKVQQICGTLEKLAVRPDAYFDLILCHNVFEYAVERAEIMAEFNRILKPDGKISVIKHNVNGRVMQMAVLSNNFIHAHELLDGKQGIAEKYGTIHYYEDHDLEQWCTNFQISEIWGMRTFWDLQQNQDIQRDEDWRNSMLELECRVSNLEAFKNIAFFHHIILKKC